MYLSINAFVASRFSRLEPLGDADRIPQRVANLYSSLTHYAFPTLVGYHKYRECVGLLCGPTFYSSPKDFSKSAFAVQKEGQRYVRASATWSSSIAAVKIAFFT
jgi:hypothetical protein